MLLFEGATSLATSTGDLASFDSARPVAERLVAEAVGA